MRWTYKVFSALIFAAAALTQVGCMGPSIYEAGGIMGGGYHDKRLDNGQYQIYFLGQGRDFDFVKKSALYRAAEISFNNGHHYFTVTKVEDKSEDLVIRNQYGGESHTFIPIIQMDVRCTDQMPDKGFDAYHYLNSNPVPGTKEFCTIADRIKDKKNGDPDDP